MIREMRTIITIDEDLCNGCGRCVDACHEGAIALIDGKAKLMHEHFCDGLGDCLPACPTDAITFEKRLADAYNEQAVIAAQAGAAEAAVRAIGRSSGGCPGAAPRTFDRPHPTVGASEGVSDSAPSTAAVIDEADAAPLSELRQWPVQIKLVSVSAPCFQGADVLIAADCAAFAYAAFHRDFMAGKVTLIGCPKLDMVDYTEKLSEIVAANDIASITVARMSVPCCGGIERAAREAVAISGKDIPVEVRTIGTDGTLLS